MTNFQNQVYDIVKRVPKGKVATYKDIAIALKKPNSSRAVGNALHKNTNPLGIPCHRIVNSNGICSSHYAFGGLEAHAKRLKDEGTYFKNDFSVDLQKSRFNFDIA